MTREVAGRRAKTAFRLAARLPSGASALGAGCSLDGTFIRFFVRLPEAEKSAESPLQQQAAAAAAAVGALLGCLTEIFASFGVPQVAPDAVDMRQKAKDAKAKRKAREKAKKKALERRLGYMVNFALRYDK